MTEFVNSRGIRYYLHFLIRVIGRNEMTVDTYFFTRNPNGTGYPTTLPDKFIIKETRTGLPVIKRL